ncbi:MAG: DUF5777 family beta-barrel protein [Bacteroidia bacterium]
MFLFAQERFPVYGTFKGTRLYNVHTIELPGKEVLEFRVAHRFGDITSGAYNFWGIDNGASVQLSLGYGITDNWEVGISRTSTDKTYQAYTKYRFLRQMTSGASPVTLTALGSVYYTDLRDPVYKPWDRRLTYLTQIMTARKQGRFSVQVAPTWIHYNYDRFIITNDLFAVFIALRAGITRRMAITGEILFPFTEMPKPEEGETKGFYPAGALSLDIETGGHVFQIGITTSGAIAEPLLFDVVKPQLRLGFNISRVITLGDGE